MTHTQRLISTLKVKTGMTSNQIAEKTNTRGQISRWQEGRVSMGYNMAHEMCEKLGLTLSSVLLEMSNSKECKRLTDCAMEKSASLTADNK